MNQQQMVELKSKERVQLILHHKAMASMLAIKAYNGLNYVNLLNVSEDQFYETCLCELEAALNHVRKAWDLYKSKGCLSAKPFITGHFEQIRKDLLTFQLSINDMEEEEE